jgi:hypothetical protein
MGIERRSWMKVAIGIQVGVLLVLLSYWTALFCGVQVPEVNRAELAAAKDVLLVLLNLSSLSALIQTVNHELIEGDKNGKTLTVETTTTASTPVNPE